MKKHISLTISTVLAAAVLLGTSGAISASGTTSANRATSASGVTVTAATESPQTVYPEQFEASAITDYAVNGDYFAFATTEKITVFGGEIPQSYDFSVEISALDSYNDGFCYKTAGGVVYDMQGNSIDHEIKPTAFPVTPDGSGYSYTLSNGNIKIWDGTEYTIEGDFSNLKVFAGAVYAMNGNILNKITPPQTAEPLGYEIADFSATSAIAIGNTVEALDSYNIEKPHFTALKSGEYLTEVHLDAKSFDKASVSPTDYFKVGRTVKVGEEAGFNAGMSAVVLCETGNAHIISLNGKQYIKLAAAATARDFIEAEFSSAQINVPSDYIYSSPTVCDAAKLRAVSWGESVTVLGKLLKSTSPEIPCDFYKIALKDENGTEVTGYTPCSFVFEKKENNDEDKTDDPSPSNADSVKTVVLVLIVVVLVLVAVGYVTFVFTSDKKRKNK